jgi:hypothetical protein
MIRFALDATVERWKMQRQLISSLRAANLNKELVTANALGMLRWHICPFALQDDDAELGLEKTLVTVTRREERTQHQAQ